MKPAAERLRKKLESVAFLPPQILVINNVDVTAEADVGRIRDALYRQAFSPVRWVECVQAIKAQGLSAVVECGPGKALAGMIKRIDPELNGMVLSDPASLAVLKSELLSGS
jgi:[acyl-carrier-protein] S-malonyltransferase